MPQFDADQRTFQLGGTVLQYRRVKMSGASVVVAGATDRGIGVATRGGVSGESVAIRLDSAPTSMMTASEAVSAGEAVFSAASGKVRGSASGAFRVGTALEAAGADGDVIEVLPINADGAAVE